MKLIIAEKPSVARDLAKVLGAKSRRDGYIEGNGYKVSWCFGHMVQLAEPARYDESWKKWSAATLPMLPEQFKLIGIASSKDQLKNLKTLMYDNAVTSIINACDAGREGELIFRYVYDLLKCKKPVERLWLASMTDSAIKQGFGGLQPGTDYDDLADAARCRSEADWLVGLNATRAMTIRCREKGAGKELMSIGRVQTPTLAIIVNREQEIEAFVPETFWQVYASFDAGDQPEGIEPHYEGIYSKKQVDRFNKKADAQAVVDAIKGQTAKVTRTEHKEVKERHPLLFDLTSLQREANQRYGYSAQQTLDTAQALYERHKLLTYPRTDSNYLTKDMKKGLPNVVRAVSVSPYDGFCKTLLAQKALKITTRIVNDKEVGDHHAIIPTDRKPNTSQLTDQEGKIYDLVVRRFLAAFYPDAIFATTKITTTVAKHTFLTSGKVRKQAGWQEVMPPPKWRKSAKSKSGKKGTPILPNVSKGDAVEVVKQRLHEGTTQPPRRYSESALLGAMERAGNKLEDAEMRRAMKEAGLGTPATRASIIETLLRREYIARKGKMLVPLPKGRLIIEAMPAEELKSASLTGEWEARLTRVAEGEMARTDFMAQVRTLTGSLTDTLLNQALTIPQAILDAARPEPEGEILGTCPVCSKPVREDFKVFACDTGRACSFVIFKSVASRKMSNSLVKVLLSGETTKTLKGFKSKQKKPFEAALTLTDEGKVTFVFGDRPASSAGQSSSRGTSSGASRRSAPREERRPDPVPALAHREPPASVTKKKMSLMCPECEEGGIVRGKRAWGCSRWRQGCGFVLAFEQQGVRLSDEQGAQLLRFGELGPLESLQGGKLVLDLEQEGNIHYVARVH